MRWTISEADREENMPKWLKDKTGRGARPPSPVNETMVIDDIAIVDDLNDEGVMI
jgi:hypothetical protein